MIPKKYLFFWPLPTTKTDTKTNIETKTVLSHLSTSVAAHWAAGLSTTHHGQPVRWDDMYTFWSLVLMYFCSRATCAMLCVSGQMWRLGSLPTTTVSLGRARTDAQMDQIRMFGNMFGCFTHRFKVDVNIPHICHEPTSEARVNFFGRCKFVQI